MSERSRTLKDPGSRMSGLMRSAEAGEPVERILTRQDASGDEAALIRARLAKLTEEKDAPEARLAALESRVSSSLEESLHQGRVTEHSPPREKIAVFRSLFRGRDDVYPKRWENARTRFLKQHHVPRAGCALPDPAAPPSGNTARSALPARPCVRVWAGVLTAMRISYRVWAASVTSLQERVSLRGRLARIVPAVVILAVLWGCGGGSGGPPAVPETDPATGRSSLPPGIPTGAYLWMDTFRPGAPVMEFGGSVHVGADVAPAADALAGNGERNGVALSNGTVRDGTSAADVVRYLRTAASHNVSAGSVTGLATYPEAQTMSVVLVSGKETRNWDTRFGRLTQDAVGIVNAALPFERQIRISPHLTPEGSGGAFLGRAVGEIWVQFIPKTHPVYPGGADPLELGRTAVFYHVRDEGAATLEISEDGAGYSTVIIDSERAASLSDPEVVHVLVHELLHAVGFVSHTDPREFDSTLSEAGFFPGTQPRALIHPIDREGVLAAYSRFAPGALPEDITAESLGPWADASSHVRGDLGIGAGEIAFGVAFRNGLAQPWAFGPKPGSALGHDPALSGSVNWSGALLGITPSGRGVVSDSSLTLDMESLSGELAFTGMRYEGGGPWGDGDLRYAVRASGSDNTFARSDAEFIRVGPGYAWSGKDLGAVTGVFFGSGHEGMGGVLERHDLSAAFGGKR